MPNAVIPDNKPLADFLVPLQQVEKESGTEHVVTGASNALSHHSMLQGFSSLSASKTSTAKPCAINELWFADLCVLRHVAGHTVARQQGRLGDIHRT
jgi:hypothetical protein